MSKKSKYTKEMCVESARKYSTVTEWRENEPRLASAAYRKGYYSECIEHIKTRWTDEELIEIARKYKTRTEWAREDHNSYNAARRRLVWIKCVEHMGKPKTARRWTEDKCLKEAMQYDNYSDFLKENRHIVVAASRINCLDKLKSVFNQ